MTFRLLLTGLGAAAVLVVLPTAALAHGDSRLVDDVLTLAPGASARFAGTLHYHRLTATVDADGPVTVALVHAASGRAVASAGPRETIRLNQLVRCCEETAWADHDLMVTNPGDQVVTVRADARLIHDDLAVMVDGAEQGTRAAVVVIGAAWAALMWHAVRRRPRDATLLEPLRLAAAASVGVLAIAAYGAARYGGDGPEALVAGLGGLPVLPFNPVVSRASLLMAVGLFLWGRGGLRWARVDGAPSAGWNAIGAALIGMVVVVAVGITSVYGHGGVAVASAVVAIVPVLAVLVLRTRRSMLQCHRVGSEPAASPET